MSFWTAAVIIVAITTFGAIFRTRIKSNTRQSDEASESLSRRIERLEERIANLETIVLEKEKAKQFSDL
jgi:hypothetical protein